MVLPFEELTEKIIGAAIAVHRHHGPGFIESIYENSLVIELRKQGLQVDAQFEILICYDNVQVGRHILDLFVERRIVVELKVVTTIEDIHFAKTRSYLKAAKCEHGLILNFAKPTLEIRRVIYQPKPDVQ